MGLLPSVRQFGQKILNRSMSRYALVPGAILAPHLSHRSTLQSFENTPDFTEAFRDASLVSETVSEVPDHSVQESQSADGEKNKGH